MEPQGAETGSSAGSQGLTPAQLLMEKHEADGTHRPTVEDAVDEEDIAHPPPSTASAASAVIAQPAMSEKAAGKQKATEEPVPSKGSAAPDTQSEEMFPSLGAPKPRAPVVTPAWSKKISGGGANGVNGPANGVSASSNLSSRASTPASSGIGTPGVGRGPAPQVSLPGRHTERIHLAQSQMTPRTQMKKPMKDVLNDINRRSKAKVTYKEAPGAFVFEGTGTVEAVRLALKEVAKELGSKQSVKVPVPASLRPFIIGREGATINGIKKRTGARIQIPKQEDTPMQDDDDFEVDILIEGDAVAAELARREIEAIISERTSRVNWKLKDIPAEFYPFLAGAHNTGLRKYEDGRDLRVQIPHYNAWTSEAPPLPAAKGEAASFVPQSQHSIHLAGDRKAAQEVRAEIERQVEQLKRLLTIESLEMERGRHQFIFADQGSSHDFLEETGCAVILPPNNVDTESVFVVGPSDKIENGMNKVMDLAGSMNVTNVDVARPHGNSHAHARNLTRYLKHRQAIEELERQHNARIVLPPPMDGPSAWQLFSRDGKNSIRARSDILNLVNAYPPSRISSLELNSFYHSHLEQKLAQQIRDEHGVHVVIPESEEPLLLVFEGPEPPAEYEMPRGAPNTASARDFQRALQQAQQAIDSLISKQPEIISRDVEAPSKFFDKIRRYVERQQQGLPQDQIPPQVLYGQKREGEGRSGNGVSVRGPSNAVSDLEAKLLAFIEQEEKDELERSYTTSCDFPQKYAKILIGTQGANIKKLRDEFDVDIRANEGRVDFKGPKAKADAARAHVLSLAKKLADEATHTLKIAPQYHRDLIGAKGTQVNRLQDRYNVRITFPRNASNDDDAATEGGQSQRNFRPQPADEVVIRGPSRGADEARDELFNLLKYLEEHSNVVTISVAQSQVPSLIGSGGKEMDQLRLTTGAQIDVPGIREGTDASGRVEIKIKGTKKQVEDAKKILQQRVKAFDNTVTRTIEVDKKHHRALIGTGGANIRDLVVKAGGPDDARERARMVRFPSLNSEGNTISVEGDKAVVDKIAAAIEELVRNRETEVTETIEVAPQKHRSLIGPGGETRRSLESKFSVSLDIPRQNTTGPARSQVKIAGQPAAVQSAKEHILGLVKTQEGEVVQVPAHLHHAISDNGQFFRRLRHDYAVTVDHEGRKPPPKSSPSSASSAQKPGQSRKVNGDLPLITDEPASPDSSTADTYSWEIVDTNPAPPEGTASSDTIPWVLRGQTPSANVAKARELLERALTDATKPSATGYLILPDPRAYRLVVGPGGSKINEIRKKTGTRVSVPRDQAKGEAIEIVGPREGVEEARAIIWELVKGGMGRRG